MSIAYLDKYLHIKESPIMRKFIISLAIACISLAASAQTSNLKCIYSSTPVVSDQVRQMQNVYIRDMVISKIRKEKKTYTMYVTGNKYLFSRTNAQENQKNMLIGSINSIYIDMDKDSIISEKTIIDKKYIIKDVAITPRWKMTDEKKVINGKECTKAIARGPLKIEAWYTPEIPFGFGPLGHYGLPGLIVELDTPTEVFTLKNFEYLITEPELKPATKGQLVSDAEFDKIQDDYFVKYGEVKSGDVKIVER